MSNHLTNKEIATLLDRIAELLEIQEENPHRIRAYENAARSVEESSASVAHLAASEDRRALMELPGIGEALANLIIDIGKTGESTLLRQLEEQTNPEAVFTRVPGIGDTLARRIREELNIQTLEELEMAAHDGRLEAVEGFGEDRIKAVQTSLAGMLSESTRRRARQRTSPPQEQTGEPSIEMLLAVDAEYRRRAQAGDLKTIAPKRFNPEGKAWLPVFTTERDGWSFTTLFSNTARAHEAGKTDDWVVVYFKRAGVEERQRTVVTETKGPLTGRRVVRGREADTKRHYGE